jgi:glycerol-3-phosphate dehydrogenase subunit C
MDHPHQPVELTLDQCIKCNICVTKCPVTPVTDLFPGPKYEGPQAGRFRQSGGFSPDKSVDYCSGCRVCNLACPTGVRIAEINARARASMVSQGKFSWRTRLRNNLIARSELVGKIGQPIAPLANFVMANKAIRWGMDRVLGIHREAPLPAFSSQRFTDWFHHRPRPRDTFRQVAFFHGCAAEYYEPRVARAAVRVLEVNGFEVLLPRQNCCGLPLLSNGEFPAARRYHASNVRHLVEYARQGISIVGTSTSCILTIKEEAPELLDFYSEDARLVAEHSYDLSEFLMELYEEGTLNLDLRPLPLSLPYHAPCQYRAHRLGRPAAEVMELIQDLKISESKVDCCGVAGTYGYKSEKYQIGMDVGSPLFEFARQAGSPLVVCDSETCRWQITHATGIPSIHPIELLAVAYGFPAEGPLAEALRDS